MLSPTELMQSYLDYQDDHMLDSACLQLDSCSSSGPVKSTARQVYRLLATALCRHCDPLLARMLRGCIADAINFDANAEAVSVRSSSGGQPSSELATITALDIPEALSHFPCGFATRRACRLADGDLASRFGGSRCEELIASRLRDVYFPRSSAKLLVNLQLSEFLEELIDTTSCRLFARLFATSDDTIVDSSSTELPSCSTTPGQQLLLQQHPHRASSATAAAAALNTDGSNSYRPHHRQHHQGSQHEQPPPQQQHQQPLTSSTAGVQRLCHLHASGARQPAGESSCVVCAARHFLQQHLTRIARDPANLDKLERTLRDCMQLQAHWCKSLQWIAANVKESRLPEFVRPLVTSCCSEDGGACGRSVTVNPQIIITTDGHVSAKCNWDKKSAS